MQDLLSRVQIPDFDADSYFSQYTSNTSQLPNLAVSVSGGGWRALMNGAGALTAFDNRTSNATAQGHLGGILQSATYLTGLSGGSWLVGSIFMNNFSTVPNLQYGGNVWQFQNSILEGPPSGGIQLFDTVSYYTDLEDQVSGKDDAGFDISITDYWARALSFQLINAPDGGPAYTWSSIALSDDFQNGQTPMPIIIADERQPGEILIPGNTTIFEMNPFEFGSFDAKVFGFVPMANLGTNFTDGKVANTSECVVGFDNSGFLMGTSSTLFNQILFYANDTALPSFLQSLITKAANVVGALNNDISQWKPNPFYGWNEGSNPNARETTLNLVDGGENLENIPLHPVIQPERNVDIVLAVDSSADVTGWPNGTSLVATYQRSLNATTANGTSFPSIPDQNTFVNLGLNNRPTFFGCNASNTSSPTPIVVYLPNSPYTADSNVSTFQLSYNQSQRNEFILNGYNVATMANSSGDPDWAICLSCAILSRSFDRTQTTVPNACTTCFDRYCWNGTTNSTTPSTYEPPMRYSNNAFNASSTSTSSSSSSSSSSTNTSAAVHGSDLSLVVGLFGVLAALILNV